VWVLFIDSIKTELMEAILTSSHDIGSDTTIRQDKWWDNWKSWERNETSEDSYLGTSPKLKSLRDLSIRVNPEVTEEVMYHVVLWVDGGLHLCLNVCKVIHSSLESSDPFYNALSLINPITNVPLQRSVPVRVPSRDGDSGSEARLGVTLRGLIITIHMVTWVATPIHSVPLGLLRVSLQCSHGLLCYLHASSPASARWSCEAVAHLSHMIKLQCKTFIRVQSKA
jgi:hypothetical protein